MTATTAGLHDAPESYDELNRYSQVIVDEARRRGIHVEVLDPSTGELALSLDGRRVTTVESLSELTSAVAFRRCDHKAHTRRVLERVGLRVPPGRTATFDGEDVAFLRRWEDIVVKPARGEGGAGVSVGVVDPEGLAAATEAALTVCPEVLLEQRFEGEDLRVLVIGGQVVAASVRRPPAVTGTGVDTVAELVGSLSRSRSAATAGASHVPLDDTTLDVVRAQGYEFESVLPRDTVLAVRRTANLHTGGTIHDVTDDLHPDLAAVSVRAAEAIDIPVLGLDLVVPAVNRPDYVIIEANEQPGLANHEPQPTVERFIDLLFPA
ncbi:MAG: hypothetical protein QOD63_346 [Actinomycetota bacterium]|nr:hypothetical protein [Actinomycetota bacterium]